MISMTCSCGGDFWVRDRLAGKSTQCPTCGTTLAIPPMSSIESRLTPARCHCGEVFWSASWRPGRRTKCPVCGRAVGGPETTSSGTVSLTAQSNGSAEAVPVVSKSSGSAETLPAGAPWNRLRDRLPTGGPALVGTLIVVATLAVFGVMIWSGMATDPGEGDQIAATGDDPGEIKPPPPPPTTPGEPARDELPPAAPVPAPLASLPEAFRTARMRLLIPAYFYPGGPDMEHWNRLIDAADRAPIAVIVNPSSGPGGEPNADYAAVLRRADAAGLLTIGYVNTDYAKRPVSQAKDDIDRWVRFYPEIDGVFLDAQASSEAHLDYYVDLCAYVRSKVGAALVVSNAGTSCDPTYFRRPTADVIVLFENFQGFDGFHLPQTLAGEPPLRFAAMPYAIAGATEMRNRINEAIVKGIGCIYLTDAGQTSDSATASNPWGRLPTYWDEEVDAVGRVNQRLAP